MSDLDDVTAKACSKKIASLREQVEKLKAEKVIAAFESGLDLGAEIAEQLAALAEQNEKMREALQECQGRLSIRWEEEVRIECLIVEAISLPDLASPVLNRIRAEGMMMAAEICDEWRSGCDNRTMQAEGWAAAECAEAIRARADELEKSNG